MAIADLVLIDTSIWIPFFNRPQSREKQSLDELLDDDRAALIGPVLTEILLGFRRDEQADWVASELRGLQFVPVTWNDWRAAAKLGRGLVANGHILPQTDLVLAAVALAHHYAVFSNDPHFDLVPNLKRFSVATD
jgi:predicted nucleic acid-binding protein